MPQVVCLEGQIAYVFCLEEKFLAAPCTAWAWQQFDMRFQAGAMLSECSEPELFCWPCLLMEGRI